MKKTYLLFAICYLLFAGASNAAEDPNPLPRVSVFSTSTDWEAITGLRLGQYEVSFTTDNKLVANGLELYFLDGFPCFGQTDTTNLWIGPNNRNNRGRLRLVCLYPPEIVRFAWRNVDRNAIQNATTGILECTNEGRNSIKIDLSKCTRGKEWKEFR